MKFIIVIAMLFATPSYAVIKCVPTTGGGTCCWDTDKDGPFKPFVC